MDDPRFTRFANEFVFDVLTLLARFPGQNKDALIALGEFVYPVTFALTDDDERATNQLDGIVRASTGEEGAVLKEVLRNPSNQLVLVNAARWADQAFPQIVIGHKFAAAMAATVVRDPEVIAHIRPPFKAFLLEVPPDLFPIEGYDAKMRPTGGFEYITRVLVRYGRNEEAPTKEAWHINAFTTGYAQLWRIQDTAGLIAVEQKQLGPDDSEFALPVEAVDQRSMLLLSRLILNVCLAFSDPSAVKPLGRAKTASSYRAKGSRIEPQVRVFQLGKPVAVDARQEIREFALRGNARPPSVQTLVRGHWKPRLGARLGHPVWVEPYWRGVEDAPIMVRPRTLKEF